MYEEVEVNSERWFDLKPLKNEIWKDIKELKDYQVSNYGRIKCFIKCNAHPNAPRIIGHKVDKGYRRIKVKNKTYQIHRLVAKYFLEEINGKNEVNHIDGNPNNNMVTNLEYCTHQENIQHAWDNNLFDWNKNSGANCKDSKKIVQYDLNMNFIKEWDCMHDVTRTIGVSYQNVYKVCKGKRKSAGGYIWKYKEEII